MQRRGFLKGALALGAATTAGVAGLPLARLQELAAAPLQGRDPGLKLNQNENPVGLSPMARRALAERIADGSRYPGPLRTELIERLAALNQVPAASIVLGTGSTELIRMAVQSVVAGGGTAISGNPSYGDVVTYSRAFGRDVILVPLRADHTLDLGRMAETANGQRGRTMLFVCNPNNPTGTLSDARQIDALIAGAREDQLVVVDEAYHDYVEDPAYRTYIRQAAERPNLVVLRTFSKIYGMAGLRVGYAVAHPRTADSLRAFATYLNISQPGLIAAIASLDDVTFPETSRRANRESRAVLLAGLRELNIEHVPSHTNFVMHRIAGDLQAYITRMRERDVQVGRPFPPMLGHNRISLGTAEEMGRFVDILREFRRRGWV